MQYRDLLNSYDKNGYVYDYLLLKNGNTKLEYRHRIIWERAYGKIPKGYEIHHINRNKKDNTISNVALAFVIEGKIVLKSGNLLCLPSYLHTKLFHNIRNK